MQQNKSKNIQKIKLKPARKQKRQLEPLLNLKYTLSLFNKLGFYVFGDYMEPKWTWKWNFKLYICTTVYLFGASCLIFEMYKNRNEFIKFLIGFCLTMSIPMALQRLFKWASSHKEILKMNNHLLEFTDKWEKESEGINILTAYHRFLRRITQAYLIFIATFATSIGLGPIIVFLFTGKMVLLLDCFLPGIYYETHPGFDIHCLFHIICTVYVATSITSVVIFVFFIIFQNCIEIDILRERLKQLTIYLLEDEPNQEKIVEKMKGIFQNHQEFLEFIDSCEDFVGFQNLTDHAIIGVQTCLALYICLHQFWLMGYFMIVTIFLASFLMDLLGTVTEVKMEKFCTEVYDIPWYLMSAKNQKMFCYFLGNTQKTNRLSIGGRAPMCLDTLVRFYKGIYSYLMVLRETSSV